MCIRDRVLSTHTGGLGTPARLDGCAYGEQALEHYHALGVEFDCIYTGYLGGEDPVSYTHLDVYKRQLLSR